MNKELHKFISRRIWEHPILYSTGGDVIERIFFSGGCYEWENGNLVYSCEEDYVDHLETFEIFLNNFPNVETSRNIGEKYFNDFVESFYKPYYEEHIAIRNNCDNLAKIQTLSWLNSSFMLNDFHDLRYHYPVSEYSLLMNIPENINPMWQEAVEIALWIFETYPDYFEDRDGIMCYLKEKG